MRILSWNIRGGGVKRVGSIVATVARHGPDVVVFTEYHRSGRDKFVPALEALGFSAYEDSRPAPRGAGVAIFSKTPLTVLPGPFSDALAERWHLPVTRSG